MCGIAGIISRDKKDVFNDLADMLSVLSHRGPEGFGISTEAGTKRHKTLSELNQDKIPGNTAIGHCLLSITGKGTQPFASQSKKFSLAHNGEIYNYRELSSKKVQSDSEAIVHFLEGYSSVEKGISDFMEIAIGKYAIAIQSGNTLYAFRDVLGIKPIWFGSNNGYLAFASEPGALKKINMQFPQPLLPGHLLKITEKGIETKKIYDLKDFRKTVPKDFSEQRLEQAFRQSIEFRTDGLKKAGIFFSGGVDSTLIAMAVAEQVKNTVCFTAGMEGSEDIKFSEKIGQEAGLSLIVRVTEKDEIPAYALKTMKSLNYFDTMQLGIGIPEYVAAEEAAKQNFKVVFSGQGSDEIFAGYSNYKNMLLKQTHKDVEESIWTSLDNMWNRNLMRDDAVTAAHSLEMRLPFLDLNFLREAMAIPASMKILSKDDQLRKHPIRNLAKKFNVPESAIQRPKKAMQYGSGIAKEVEKLF